MGITGALFGLVVLAALAALLVFLVRRRFSPIVRVGLVIAQLPVMLFAAFGFLATFEPPSPGAQSTILTFRILYGAVIVLGVVASIFLLIPAPREGDD